mgnify:CR=1 FL=1
MKEYTYTEKKDTRSGFGAGLAELGRKNPNVVALCADLIGSLKMNKFIEENPNRFFQIGIAEANMMGIAAGLTIGGKIPFTGTFANFSTGRVYDQIRQSIAYSGKNVKICASHAGVTLGEDGATHQILEDIGLMKMLPGMVVINPCDYNQTKAATIAIADYIGPVYLRFGRPAVPVFTPENQVFEIGKAAYVHKSIPINIPIMPMASLPSNPPFQRGFKVAYKIPNRNKKAPILKILPIHPAIEFSDSSIHEFHEFQGSLELTIFGESTTMLKISLILSILFNFLLVSY